MRLSARLVLVVFSLAPAVITVAALRLFPEPPSDGQAWFRVLDDYHWFWFMITAPVYWFAMNWVFAQVGLFVREAEERFFGASAKDLLHVDLHAPGLFLPWRASYTSAGRVRTSLLSSTWLAIPLLCVVGAILLRVDDLRATLLPVHGLHHWSSVHPGVMWSMRCYGLFVMVLLPHLWLKWVQCLEGMAAALNGRAMDREQVPPSPDPDGTLGLSRSWDITFSMATVVLISFVGWSVAVYATVRRYNFTDPSGEMHLLLSLFLPGYIAFSVSSFAPILIAHRAMKRRKRALVAPWQTLLAELRERYLAASQSGKAHDPGLAEQIVTVKQEVEDLDGLPDLPAKLSQVLSFLGFQALPAILSALVLLRELLGEQG